MRIGSILFFDANFKDASPLKKIRIRSRNQVLRSNLVTQIFKLFKTSWRFPDFSNCIENGVFLQIHVSFKSKIFFVKTWIFSKTPVRHIPKSNLRGFRPLVTYGRGELF